MNTEKETGCNSKYTQYIIETLKLLSPDDDRRIEFMNYLRSLEKSCEEPGQP